MQLRDFSARQRGATLAPRGGVALLAVTQFMSCLARSASTSFVSLLRIVRLAAVGRAAGRRRAPRQKFAASLSPSETILDGVGLGIHLRRPLDFRPVPQAPLAHLGRLAIRRYGAGVTNAIFVDQWRDAGDLAPLTRGQCEIHRSGRGLYPILTNVPCRREAQELHGRLLRQSWLGAERQRQKSRRHQQCILQFRSPLEWPW